MDRDRKAEEIGIVSPVTTIIRQKPLPSSIEVYESWLKEIIPIAQSFAGHQSVSVIRPAAVADAYTIVLHFDNVAHLLEWLESEERKKLIAKIQPHLGEPEGIDIKTGFEFWFTPPPIGKPAKPYKQFLITLSAIYPLTLLVPAALQPAFEMIPHPRLPGVQSLITAIVIVALMVWLIMPRYTRLLSRWLFR